MHMELQNLGVSQSAVGKGVNACTFHLCGREVDSIISCRTAGRMVRRGDIQVAMKVHDHASKGLHVGQDTTRRGTEHLSTAWSNKGADGSVGWLPNHTADVQTSHILDQLQGFNELMQKMNLLCNKQLSIAHVKFIGDTIAWNGSMLALQALINKQLVSEEEQEQL